MLFILLAIFFHCTMFTLLVPQEWPPNCYCDLYFPPDATAVQVPDKKLRSGSASTIPILSNSQQISVMMLVKHGLDQDDAVKIAEVMTEEDHDNLLASIKQYGSEDGVAAESHQADEGICKLLYYRTSCRVITSFSFPLPIHRK